MALSEYDSLSAVSVGTSPISVINGTTTIATDTNDGLYQLVVDGANMAKADEYKIKCLEKCLSGSTQRTLWEATLSDVQTQLFVSPFVPLMHGWDFTIEKVAGTDRAFDASIRRVDSAALTEYDSLSAVSISTTEISVISGTSTLQNVTDDGIYWVLLDPVAAAVAKGDDFRFRVKEKTLSGSTQRLVLDYPPENAQSELFITPPMMFLHGWDATLLKVAGTDRSWDASVRRVA